MKQLIARGRYLSLLIPLFILVACGQAQEPASSTPDMEVEPSPTMSATIVLPPATAAPDEDMGDETMGRAFIDELRLNFLESFPVQVRATVSGNLSDGCTAIASTSAQQAGSDFQIQIETSRDPELLCAQVLAPFEETIELDVSGLPAGTYTVTAGNQSENFTLTVDNQLLEPTPDLSGASLTIGAASVMPGQRIDIGGAGYPAGATVEIGFGRQNSEYDIIAAVEAGADGRFTTQIEVPAFAETGEPWVFVADVANAKVIAEPILITAADAPIPAPDTGVNEPVNGQFTRTYMFLIAVEDNGRSGQLIGCNDSVVPVVIEIEPTVAPMTSALNRMLSLEDEFYGQSGLYNVFYQSDLTVDGIDIEDRAANVHLSGTLALGGVCDNPRVIAQLEQTILQYSSVDSAAIFLNGEPLERALSGQ